MAAIAALSVLDVPDRELVLRICGSARQGQIVRLKSGKCTIGSGPRCTLRLRARGVQPLHCLILRGAAKTVIRRWAPDTRLNGHAFSDAELVPGDRLGIGPLEFELLDAAPLPQPGPAGPPQTASRQPAAEPGDPCRRNDLTARLALANRQGRSRVRGLLERLRSAQRQIAQLQEEQADSADRPERGEQRSNGRQVELDALAAELGQHEKALHEQQEQLSQQAASLEKRSTEIEQAQAELEARQRALDERRCQTVADEATSSARSAEEAEKTEAELAELQTQRESLQRDRDRWEAELAETQDRLRRQADELDARQAQLDARQQALQTERRQWTAQRDEAQQELDATAAELGAGRAELDNQREALQEQRDLWQAERAELEARPHQPSAQQDARAEQLDARQAELDGRQAELDGHQAELDARSTELQATGRPSGAGQPAADDGHEGSTVVPDSGQEAQFETPDSRAPLSSEEVFRRMGMVFPSYGVEPEENAPDTSEPEQNAPDISEPEQNTPDAPEPDENARAAPEPDPGQPDPADETRSESDPESDESIDDYMARLLDRVKQTADDSTAPQPPSRPSKWKLEKPPDATPRAEPAEATSPPPETPEPPEAMEMSPRAVAPEKSVDLTAMRELANFSAHAAIYRHARRMLFSSFRGRLFVIITGLAGAAVLTWIWWAKDAPNSTLYPAGVCFLVALLWGIRYALAAGHIIVDKSGRLEWNPKGSQPPAGSGQPAASDEPPV